MPRMHMNGTTWLGLEGGGAQQAVWVPVTHRYMSLLLLPSLGQS